MTRVGYVRGLAQRRVKYRFDLEPPRPIAMWVAEDLGNVATLLEEEWGAVFCPIIHLPSLGSLLIEWNGGHLVADVSICTPVSHPGAPHLSFEIPVDRVDICVEPIAPPGTAAKYITLHTPTVKSLGRVTLRGGYAIVKYRGLLFAVEARWRGNPRGGITLELARYRCEPYNLGEAVRKLKSILEPRRM
ncbi:hypothetical protein Pogu_1734 [Pyrobaculum oguniense TE7]|uniref:Uncharacterized protein n=1 Tax=Pyrobaculum oguniense (strain DSM 13380 / JCM 10595 / TE7) TaxID=698757 RepID=H6QCE7_PYROT|nr:hypothetical protein Pogu_1734 [Pyrobaculum oguniense TE7]